MSPRQEAIEAVQEARHHLHQLGHATGELSSLLGLDASKNPLREKTAQDTKLEAIGIGLLLLESAASWLGPADQPIQHAAEQKPGQADSRAAGGIGRRYARIILGASEERATQNKDPRRTH